MAFVGAHAEAAMAHVALVQGVPAPLAAPLLEVWRLCRHPDRFLYVCIKPAA